MVWLVELSYRSASGVSVSEFESASRERAEKEYAKWNKHPDRFIKIELIQVLTDRRNRDRIIRRVVQKNRGFDFNDEIPF